MGILAFERGRYRESIERLTAALDAVPRDSREGGEARIWLVSAYQAVGDMGTATELCRELSRHPVYSVREQAGDLLSIIEAPRLKRPGEWMSEIPDLERLSEGGPKFEKGSSQKKAAEISPPMRLDRQGGNRFIPVAIGAILLLLVGLLLANSP
jgi:hypothetical protein